MAAYKIQKHNKKKKKKKSAITYLLFILALARRLISWLIPEFSKLDQPSCPLKRRKTSESEDIIIISYGNSKLRAKFGALFKLEDHDFNRVIYPAT